MNAGAPVKEVDGPLTAAHAVRMTNNEDLERDRRPKPHPGNHTVPTDHHHIDGELQRGDDPNDLDADNAVEDDMIEAVDPDNAPA